LVKNPKFGQKSKIWSKIQNLVKIQNLAKNLKFGQKSKIWSIIQNLAKNIKSDQKSILRPNLDHICWIDLTVCQAPKFDLKPKFWSKVKILKCY